MAHDVDQFNIDTAEMRRPDSYATVPSGTHSAETQIRNQNTMQLFRATIGSALLKLDRWANLDPAKGGSGVFSEDWKEQREGIRVIIEDKVCQACEHKFSAREFARLHDYSAFRTILDHRRVLDEVTGSVLMRVPVIVRDAVALDPARDGEPRLLRRQRCRAGLADRHRVVRRSCPPLRPQIRRPLHGCVAARGHHPSPTISG